MKRVKNTPILDKRSVIATKRKKVLNRLTQGALGINVGSTVSKPNVSLVSAYSSSSSDTD